MLKILTSQQIKALDSYTIQHEPIASIDLMERACRVFVNWFTQRFDTSKKIGVVCGTGNNGGDGLGIARLLNSLGYAVKVWIVRGSAPQTDDFKINLEKLLGRVEIYEITTTSDRNLFTDRHILIDAVFGSGLSRPLEGIYEQAINCINQTEALRIAVDIPSGLMADGPTTGIVCRADYTISFHLPKLAFLLPENYQYTGEWHVLDIGLSKIFIEETSSSYYLLEKQDLLKIKKHRSKFDHKGNYGKALIISGSYGKMGAAVLATKAAMRSGVGLLTTHMPKCGYSIMQTAIPESMASVDEHVNFFTNKLSFENYDAVGIGPGIGIAKETVKAFAAVLENIITPIVIDADGLNILSANRELLNLIPEGSVLTPHPKEFERMVGGWKSDFERLEKLKQFATKTKTIVILKGAYSAISSPAGELYFNPTGNPGMATGGSGDVLTGILTSLLAQRYAAIDAAKLGVYLHGLAGDFAAKEKGMDALIASDIIDMLPNAFKTLDS